MESHRGGRVPGQSPNDPRKFLKFRKFMKKSKFSDRNSKTLPHLCSLEIQWLLTKLAPSDARWQTTVGTPLISTFSSEFLKIKKVCPKTPFSCGLPRRVFASGFVLLKEQNSLLFSYFPENFPDLWFTLTPHCGFSRRFPFARKVHTSERKRRL